jgi:hypothetical protein
MEIIYNTYENNKDIIINNNCYEDCIVGNILHNNGVPLLSDSKIYMESPFNIILGNPENVPVPYIGDESGRHLAIQHYLSGRMEELSHYHKLF